MIEHAHTLDEDHCPRCRADATRDRYRHGRVDNWYRRAHLRALALEPAAALELRRSAARALRAPDYPMSTRRWAGAVLEDLA
jgi:hypothetical protein